jgi:hypothetical protein
MATVMEIQLLVTAFSDSFLLLARNDRFADATGSIFVFLFQLCLYLYWIIMLRLSPCQKSHDVRS